MAIRAGRAPRRARHYLAARVLLLGGALVDLASALPAITTAAATPHAHSRVRVCNARPGMLHQCVSWAKATRNTPCVRPVNFSRYVIPEFECVWQPAELACPPAAVSTTAKSEAGLHGGDVCVPIESMRNASSEQAFRTNLWRLSRLNNQMSSIRQQLLYKSELTGAPEGFRGRRVYIDLGANRYGTSIAPFRASYHLGRTFHVIAFEMETAFDASYTHDRRHRNAGADVELHHLVAWTSNTTLRWLASTGSLKLGARALRANEPRPTSGPSRNVTDQPAIDIADFLKRRVAPEDYVVLKVDVEGAEYDLIPHLIRTGSARLIDEVFVELHTNANSCCKPPFDVGRHWEDAMRLLRSLREAGIYAHQWM